MLAIKGLSDGFPVAAAERTQDLHLPLRATPLDDDVWQAGVPGAPPVAFAPASAPGGSRAMHGQLDLAGVGVVRTVKFTPCRAEEQSSPKRHSAKKFSPKKKGP